jgi:hypothetical protein
MIITLSVFVLGIIWVYSVFSFAQWRYRVLAEKDQSPGILDDYLFNAYLTITGAGILFFFYLILTNII